MYNICGAMASLVDQAAEYYKEKKKMILVKYLQKRNKDLSIF